MILNHFGEMVFAQDDLCDAVMRAETFIFERPLVIDSTVDRASLQAALPDHPWNLRSPTTPDVTISQYDQINQHHWHMPDHYRDLDIAKHVLSLCNGEAELQRAGQELLMFQERDLFDLLRYLAYLVDVMRANNIIWGVGRGSSVASFVLYKLDVHRINSLEYDLDPRQFLR